MKIMVLRDIERDEVEFICKVSVVNHILTLSRPAQTSLFINLLCQRKTILLFLTPDDFTHQGRASGWERVKKGWPCR